MTEIWNPAGKRKDASEACSFDGLFHFLCYRRIAQLGTELGGGFRELDLANENCVNVFVRVCRGSVFLGNDSDCTAFWHAQDRMQALEGWPFL